MDWVLNISALILIGIGLLSIYSSSLGKGSFFNFYKQLMFLGVGLLLMFVVSFGDWKIFTQDPYLILFLYLANLIALAGLFLFAPVIKGVKSWYRLGPVSVDPIAPLKLILIVLLAKFFSMRHVEMYRVKHILLSGFYVFLPALLIFFQPDLGSVLVIGLLWGLILILSGIKLRHFLALVLIALLVLAVGWNFLLQDYQKQRVMSFVAPKLEPLGAGWNRRQTKIAIGAGGWLGQGIGQGSQTQYGFLPEPQTDFIFAATAEELGLLGISFMLVVFGVFLGRILKVGMKAEANFARLFCAGFASLLFVEIFINVGMNLGLLPVIGIPLPLVSYGGSSLIMALVGVGIVQSIKVNS
ncbi:MAG: rod shape-determining protein RodA [Candidatus Paceibacterota bacterium]